MNMLNDREFEIAARQLGLNPDEKLLVALSGGLDSMVLLFLAKSFFAEVIAAHCNFKLRNEESDSDQSFIENICEKWKLPHFIKQYDTKGFAIENKLSTQEAARQLRYTWFEELRLEINASTVLTAHHKDDTIETFFINLMRGSGIKGLSGIPRVNKNIKRPLFNFTKADLDDFARENNIPFREDSSNAEDKYLRNRIRHHLIPKIKEIDNEAPARIADSIDFLRISNEYIEGQAKEFIDSKFSKKGKDYSISLNIWKELAAEPALMFTVMSHFNFSPGEIEELKFIESSQSGKKLVSSKYTILRDRKDVFLIFNTQNKSVREFFIMEEEGSIIEPFRMYWSKQKNQDPISGAQYSVIFDAAKIEFPIVLRLWKQGDKFTPLGMKGSKKVSDFLIDQKISMYDKEKVFVLLSKGRIIWVVGHRIDDLVKITPETQNLIQFILPE